MRGNAHPQAYRRSCGWCMGIVHEEFVYLWASLMASKREVRGWSRYWVTVAEMQLYRKKRRWHYILSLRNYYLYSFVYGSLHLLCTIVHGKYSLDHFCELPSRSHYSDSEHRSRDDWPQDRGVILYNSLWYLLDCIRRRFQRCLFMERVPIILSLHRGIRRMEYLSQNRWYSCLCHSDDRKNLLYLNNGQILRRLSMTKSNPESPSSDARYIAFF